jgi:catabolite repression HPr-like protein
MVQKMVVVNLEKGLQARIATEFVQNASSFSSDIKIAKNEKLIAAKSIIGVMSMAIRKGEEITLLAEGADEQKAITTLEDFLSGKE